MVLVLIPLFCMLAAIEFAIFDDGRENIEFLLGASPGAVFEPEEEGEEGEEEEGAGFEIFGSFSAVFNNRDPKPEEKLGTANPLFIYDNSKAPRLRSMFCRDIISEP